MMGTWVILGSGKLVCANDRCWRRAVILEEEKRNGTFMDKGAARATIGGDETGVEAQKD